MKVEEKKAPDLTPDVVHNHTKRGKKLLKGNNLGG